jgi:hypothetical protein
MPADKQPTRDQVIAQIIDELAGPTPLETVVDRVLERKPSSAKDPRGPIRNDIRRWPSRFGVVFGDPERKIVVPVRLALAGVRFRHRVTDAEVSDRGLHWTVSDTAYLASPYWPASFIHTDPELVDTHGVVIRGASHARDISLRANLDDISLTGAGRKLPAFMREHKVASGDSLLFTIEQFNPPRWRVDHEPRAQRDQAAIDRHNKELMDALFAILESAPREEIDMPASLYSAHLQMAEPYGYPGDPWLDAMAADGRMAPGFRGIVYADTMRALSEEYEPPQFIIRESTSELAEDKVEFDGEDELPPLPEADARRIYTFKVSALYRKNLWRRVEVQGALLLADLNDYLVDVFNHDSDHMASFSKLVRRGGKRRREVELALVDPFGLGPGSELRIAELDLIEGDMLKWLFDFGDNYEYTLQLESTVDPPSAPDPNEYPRVAGANEPELLYCNECQAKGKQVVAKWHCWECSDRNNTLYMLCDDCSGKRKHEEHYQVEWVY